MAKVLGWPFTCCVRQRKRGYHCFINNDQKRATYRNEKRLAEHLGTCSFAGII